MPLKHRLDPLLRPRSVAIVGASGRAESMGEWSLSNLLKGGYTGPVYPVNPRYDSLGGLACYDSVASLPEIPDLVIFAVGDQRIEASLDEAIAAGVPAAVIMSSLVLDDDDTPPLKARIQKKVRDAGMLVCGANGMGFYNIRDRVWGCGFDSREHRPPGNVTMLSHSGSGMCGIVDCDERLQFNLVVSCGNELAVTMDQYLDFALDLPETRAVGLFIETARSPEGFRAALEKAAQRAIPIVALKVGRTEESARLTVSHSGAMAGDDATYDALFDRYGVQRVQDMDELATALILFAGLHPVGPGSLVSLHDSGGERQLMVDLADAAGVPLTRLAPDTVAALEQVIDPELPAVNPLDGWSRGGEGAARQMTDALATLMQDPGAAMAALVHDRAPGGIVYPTYVDYMREARERSGKPVALVGSRQGTGCDARVVTVTHDGYPVLDGVQTFLNGVRALFAYRDFLAAPAPEPPVAPAAAADRWRKVLGSTDVLGEAEAMSMLADFGLAVTRHRRASTREQALAAAGSLAAPFALKTAARGVLHKSDRGGVRLGIATPEELAVAYDEMSASLGPDVLVAEMAEAGVEMILGVKYDPQFGPVVMLGSGGVLAEVLKDVRFALPPFDARYARKLVDGLRLRPLLDGVRGRAAADIDGFCRYAARFSAMVHALRDDIREVDINPVIVGTTGCMAVDALVVAARSRSSKP